MAIGKSREEYWQEQYYTAHEVFFVTLPRMDSTKLRRLATRYADRKAQELFGVKR